MSIVKIYPYTTKTTKLSGPPQIFENKKKQTKNPIIFKKTHLVNYTMQTVSNSNNFKV